MCISDTPSRHHLHIAETTKRFPVKYTDTMRVLWCKRVAQATAASNVKCLFNRDIHREHRKHRRTTHIHRDRIGD